MKYEIEKLIYKCQGKGGLDKCFLSEDSEVKCSYMSDRKSEIYRNNFGYPMFNIYYLCLKEKK